MFKKLTAILLVFLLIDVPVYAIGSEAEGCVLINKDTKQILYEDNAHKKLGMASTTKIMAAIIALENMDTDEVITVSENAQNQEGSSIYLRTGDKIKLIDLLYGLMLNSGNDAAVAIAEGVSGSCDEFVDLMNEKAKELGCKNTNFANPNGLGDENHYSTAYDMALIMAYASGIEKFRKISSTKEYQIETGASTTYLKNHNKLLWQMDDFMLGKTGYTKKDGRCLVSYCERGEVGLICVTLNDRNDWEDHKNLYEYGFENTKITKIIKKGDVLGTRTIRGTKTELIADRTFYLPLKDGNKNKVSCKIILNDTKEYPIYSGYVIGKGMLYFEDKLIGSIDIYSDRDVPIFSKDNFNNTLEAIYNNLLLRPTKRYSMA